MKNVLKVIRENSIDDGRCQLQSSELNMLEDQSQRADSK